MLRCRWYLALSFVLAVTPWALAGEPSGRGDLVLQGTFITIDFPGALATGAADINSRGDIVGFWDDSSGTRRGFLLSRGVFTVIEVPGAILTNATGINSAGDIAGRYTSADGVRHGFLLSQGEFTTIDFPRATRTRVSGISARGDITGDHCEARPVMPACLPQSIGNVHGFLMSDGRFTSIDVPKSVYTEAWRSNAAGEIVGKYKSADGHFHVYLRDKHGSFTTIDFPGAIETALGNFNDDGGINDRGDIVSSYCAAAPCPITMMDSTANVHGFLLTRDGRGEDGGGEFVAFDFPGALGTAPFGMNNRGNNVGAYRDKSGIFHGFLISKGEDDEED